MKKTKLTRSLLAAVSVVALSAVVYGCSSGHSDADLNAAAEKAKMEAEAAAAEKAKMEAEEAARKAEEDKQAALEAERQKAAEEAAAAEKMARATAQTNAITNAIAAAEAALGMVGLDASAADITAAEEAIAAITTAIEAAVDVDDTSMYTAQTASLQGRLMTAKANIQQADDAETARLAQIEATKAVIAAAETAEAAQAAKDALNDVATAAEAAVLQAAVDARIMALETMAREADQKMALMDAAGNVDTSDLSDADAIAAANTAIARLKAALAAAADVSDADKAMYQGQVDAAEGAVMTAQRDLRRAAQMMALSGAVGALQAVNLSDLSDQARVDAAKDAIAALRAALDDAADLSDAEKTTAMIELSAASRIVTAAENRVGTEDQKMMLADAVMALGAIDLDALMTQEEIEEAKTAIDGLETALAAATRLTLTDTEKFDATVALRSANRKVAAAEEMLTENVGNQRMALSDAKAGLDEIDLDDLSDQEKIDAADQAVMALKAALDGATHISDADKAMYQSLLDTADEAVKMAQTGMDRDGRMMTQRTAVTDAVTAVTTAVAAVNDTATGDQVMAADDAIAALKMAIDDAEDLGEDDTDVVAAQKTLDALMTVLASAKESRTAAMEAAEEKRRMAEAEEERKRNAEMAVTAVRLREGISPYNSNPNGEDNRTAEWNTDGDLLVTSSSQTGIALKEDKTATVADLHGWKGKRYGTEGVAEGNELEAVVYSNIGDPTPGEPFDETYGDDLTEEGVLPASVIAIADNANLIGGSGFVGITAGVKEFEKADNLVAVMIPGDFHGVSGTYSCTPATGYTCAVRKGDGADGGLELGGSQDADNVWGAGNTGGTWTFKPSDPDAPVTEMEDDMYATYGWWLHKTPNGTWRASGFHDQRGGLIAPTADQLDAVNGTATYVGGAAGKYAILNTGGAADAGHFTATATLEVDFDRSEGGPNRNPAVSGMVDDFTGADGQSRDWSVKLNETISGSSGFGKGSGSTGSWTTEWTIGGEAAGRAAVANGEWGGRFYDPDADRGGLPKVATGWFYSEHADKAAKIVGGFGTDVQ